MSTVLCRKQLANLRKKYCSSTKTPKTPKTEPGHGNAAYAGTGTETQTQFKAYRRTTVDRLNSKVSVLLVTSVTRVALDGQFKFKL